MARHRNVRSMNYADEYDGYDDVYGHSVEDDYSISPSDAAYVFDRNTQKAQISAYLAGDEDIAEEDENVEEGVESTKRRDSETLGLQNRNLSELDEARLRSCLDEIRNVIGDSLSEASLADIILANDFDVAKSLDAALSNTSEETQKSSSKIRKQENPLLQRDARSRPIADDNAAIVSRLKEGIQSINLEERNKLPKLHSDKLTFKIPKLLKPLRDSEKENVNTIVRDPMGLLSKTQDKSESFSTFESDSFPIQVVPRLKPVVSSSFALNTSQLSSLQSQSNRMGADNLSQDSDEECSTLSALIERHASQNSHSEHTTLSALADFHLKRSDSNSNSESNSGFKIPSLKVKPKTSLLPAVDNSEERLESSILNCNSDLEDEHEKNCGVHDMFVIDLLGALNPPDVRKQLERPHSRMDSDDYVSGIDEEQGDSKPWIYDRTCILDAKSVLHINAPMELKISSPMGRILCRRRMSRKCPYVRPKSPFTSDIVPFTFDTPSPDATILKHLRRF